MFVLLGAPITQATGVKYACIRKEHENENESGNEVKQKKKKNDRKKDKVRERQKIRKRREGEKVEKKPRELLESYLVG